MIPNTVIVSVYRLTCCDGSFDVSAWLDMGAQTFDHTWVCTWRWFWRRLTCTWLDTHICTNTYTHAQTHPIGTVSLENPDTHFVDGLYEGEQKCRGAMWDSIQDHEELGGLSASEGRLFTSQSLGLEKWTPLPPLNMPWNAMKFSCSSGNT